VSESQRAEWRRAIAAKNARQRTQRGTRQTGLATVTGPGTIRRPPDRAATVARLVQTAIASTPSLAAARKALESWAGHPADSEIKADALAMLGELEREARQEN
jgi:hypothetical protein